MNSASPRLPKGSSTKSKGTSVARCISLLGLRNTSKGKKPSFADAEVNKFYGQLGASAEKVAALKRSGTFDPRHIYEEAEYLLVDLGYGQRLWGREVGAHLAQSDLYPKDLKFDVETDQAR